MSECPLDYSLCDETVTVYRRQESGITRTVLENCAFQTAQKEGTDRTGKWMERSFLLVVPGDTQQVFPGDRVLSGVGPTVTDQMWHRFIPALVDDLVEVGQVKLFKWKDRLCHLEAKEAV